jgi:hypothetical protein
MLAPLDRAETAALESGLRRCIAALEGDEDAAVPARNLTTAPASRRNVKRASRQPVAS